MHYWKDKEKVEQLRRDYRELELFDRERVLCDYAHTLTVNPGLAGKEDQTQYLRAARIPDAAILDATLVIAYFNFVNRIVLSLQVELETDEGGGYKY